MNIFYKKFGRRGFTLIELIVVIAVLAIIVTMAVPRYLNQVQDARFVKACSDAKVVEDVILQKIAMAGGAAPINESTSYAADQVAGVIGDNLFDSTGRSVTTIPDGTYYPIDETEIQGLIDQELDLSKMVIDKDGNLYFAAAASGGASEEAGGHVPFPDTVTPVEIAKAAGNLLIYNTVKQVNDSVGGTTDDAHAVYEAVKEDVTPKITTWWNGLSVEDQQAFADKVRSDEDLMVSELIPQEIITDIVSQSVGYSGTAILDNDYDKQEWINESGVKELKDSLYLSAVVAVVNNYAQSCVENSYRDNVSIMDCNYNGSRYLYISYYMPSLGKWYLVKVATTSAVTTMNYYNGSSSENPFINDIYGHVTEVRNVYDGAYFTDWIYVGLVESALKNYNPDDQQSAPFYYPVNNLKMADVWDVGTASDSDLQADAAIYTAVDSPSYDVSCGASVATPLDYVGDQLVDFNTGLPLNLGSDTPWTTTNGQ